MIHPTALIHPSAQLDLSVEVGPYVVVDGAATIAEGCRLEAHAQIAGLVRIGPGTVVGRAAIIGGDPQDLGFKPETVSGVIIGAGNVIREHVTIHRGSKPDSFTRLGDGNLLMAGAHVGHDSTVGNKNVLANGCLLGGHVTMGDHVFAGGGSAFHQFIRVGDYCMIQGHGGFSMDVPPYCAGHHINQLMGLNVVGLRRHGFSREERASIKDMFELLFCSGKNMSQALEAARDREWPEAARRLLDFMAATGKRGVCRFRAGTKDED